MRVKDWVGRFVCRHVGRHPRDDWGVPAEVEEAWLRGLLRLDPKPKEDEADAASVAMLAGVRPGYAADHLPALIEAIRRARAAAAAPPDPDPAGVLALDRDAVCRLSRGCPHCSGYGLVTIFHPDYDGMPTVEVVRPGGDLVTIRARLAAHCSCPMGRWMRARCDAEGRRAIADLVGTLARTAWTLADPTDDLSAGADFAEHRRLRLVRAMARDLGRSGRGGRPRRPGRSRGGGRLRRKRFTVVELARLMRAVWAAQRHYEQTRTAEALDTAERLMRDLDCAVVLILDGPWLFDDAGAGADADADDGGNGRDG